MPTPSPSLLIQIVETCHQSAKEDFYPCLDEALGTGDSMRGVIEVCLRSMGIHIVSLAAYGHLLSLQGLTRSTSPTLFLSPLFYFFIPEISAVQLVTRFVKVCVRLLRTRRMPGRFYTAIVLGLHIQTPGSTISFEEIEENSVESERKIYNPVWFARLALLLAVLAQFSGSLAIGYRSLYLFNDRDSMHDLLDFRTIEAVLGGSFATLNSILILLVNMEWHYKPPNASIELQNESRDLEQPHSNIHQPRTGSTADIESGTIGFSLQSTTKRRWVKFRMQSQGAWNRCGRKYRQANKTLTSKLSSLLPKRLHSDLEMGFAVQCLFLFEIALHWGQKVQNLCLQDPIYGDRSKQDCEHYFRGEVFLDKFLGSRWRLAWGIALAWGIVTHSAFWVVSPNGYVAIYLVLVARVLARGLLSLFSFSRCSDRVHPAIREYANRVNDAFLSGRSLISFPFLLAFSLPIILQWINIVLMAKKNLRFEKYAKGAAENDVRTRVHFPLAMYKDPWYDQMYIL